MNIVALLTNLAHDLPTEVCSSMLVQAQTADVKTAILSNNADNLKLMVAGNRSYPNEVRVTIY